MTTTCIFHRKVIAVALISISVVACSPSPHDGTTPTSATPLKTSNDTNVSNLYVPASLVEVLECQMGTLDSSLGGRGVRADPVDVEFVQCSTKLRVPSAASG